MDDIDPEDSELLHNFRRRLGFTVRGIDAGHFTGPEDAVDGILATLASAHRPHRAELSAWLRSIGFEGTREPLHRSDRRRPTSSARSANRGGPMARIYVASSWRNGHHPKAVEALRAEGHEVYDYRDPEGWLGGADREVDPADCARDVAALEASDLCVLVLPCGRSAHLVAGWVIGRGRPTLVWRPTHDAHDLVVRMADMVTDSLDAVVEWAGSWGGEIGSG